MFTIIKMFKLLLLCLVSLVYSEPCSQFCHEGSLPPITQYTFMTKYPIKPFYQWLSNNGYCGEVSIIQAGLLNGQWISQFNARTIASPFSLEYSQTGKSKGINNNCQVLLDASIKSIDFGKTAQNYLLQGESYDSKNQLIGISGYQNFMLWIKKKILLGNVITIGIVDEPGSSGLPYGHIVTVIKIGSNYPANDTSYHFDDVLYFEDHGVITCPSTSYNQNGYTNPAIPPGAGETIGCTPYIFGYTFGSLYNSVSNTKDYQVPLPTKKIKNYGYTITGINDIKNITLPVTLNIVNNGSPRDPIADYNYENPFIGTSIQGDSKTNILPNAETIILQAKVHNLIINNSYNLYIYVFSNRPLPNAQLSVPTSDFNKNAHLATKKLTFIANNVTYLAPTYSTLSSDTVIYRCVPITAP